MDTPDLSRRAVLRGIAAGAPAAMALGAVTLSAEERHWLDTWSSQDIEAALRLIDPDMPRRLRRAATKLQRQRKATARRERRADNEVLWRGIVAEPLPDLAPSDSRAVRAARREMHRIITGQVVTWEGQELAAGTIVLIDDRIWSSRITVNGGPAVVGHRAEIIRAPHQMRVHIWASRETGIDS